MISSILWVISGDRRVTVFHGVDYEVSCVDYKVSWVDCNSILIIYSIMYGSLRLHGSLGLILYFIVYIHEVYHSKAYNAALTVVI